MHLNAEISVFVANAVHAYKSFCSKVFDKHSRANVFDNGKTLAWCLSQWQPKLIEVNPPSFGFDGEADAIYCIFYGQ